MFGAERTRLRAVWALGLVCGLLMILPGMPAAITFPAGALMVLVLPGYAVMRAMFGRLEPIEQATMTVGLSLSISIVGGMLLNLQPEGLLLPQWGGLLGGITFFACTVAWLREQNAGTAAAETPADPLPADFQSLNLDAAPAAPAEAASEAGPAGGAAAARRIPRAQLAMLGVAACILLASLGVARLGAAVEPHEPFSQLWMIPDIRGTFVELGVTNNEHRSITYRLVVTQDGDVIAQWTDIVLADGAAWEQVLQMKFRRDTHRIRATLYRPGDIEPYRETHADVRFRPNAGATPRPSGEPSGAPSPPGAPGPSGPAVPSVPASPDPQESRAPVP